MATAKVAQVTDSDAARRRYRRHGDQDARAAARHPVVIVGAGLVGLTLAIDLLQRGIPVVVLERRTGPAEGSRSICQAKRTLEIWDRLGASAPMLDRGITWRLGRVFHRDRELYSFDLLPEEGHGMPAFINLQQYLVEAFLLDRFVALGGAVRWGNAVEAVAPGTDGVGVRVATPDGYYDIAADWLIACDGAKSGVRKLLGLEFEGKVFQDKFLITDVKMQAQYPTERWFWFEPPFHSGQTALLHRQADDVWRIDLQLGWDADPELEKQPDRVRARIRAMLGEDVPFSFEWISVYVFQCRTLGRYVHGRVVFAGDSAHQVSPFGARGGNGGVQDADNLGWKLGLVLKGLSPPSLLESYSAERREAARENILNSTRATDFMTPKTAASRELRDLVLDLAAAHPPLRQFVNSGRLSTSCAYRYQGLATADSEPFAGGPAPGAAALDAPLGPTDERGGAWLLRRLHGDFTVMVFAPTAPVPDRLEVAGIPVRFEVVSAEHELAMQRYDAHPGTTYLFRPDQHVAARFRCFDPDRIASAVRRAAGLDQDLAPAGSSDEWPGDDGAWAAGDQFYRALVSAIEDLDDGPRARFLTKLVLLMAGRLSDGDDLSELVRTAAERPGAPAGTALTV